MAKRLARLMKKTGGHSYGRNAFFSELVQEVKRSLPAGAKMSAVLCRDIMRQHTLMYGSLPLHTQRNYDELAIAMDVASQLEVKEDIGMLEAAMQLHASRCEEERRESAPLCNIGNHRFSIDQLERLAVMYNSTAYSGSVVAAEIKAMTRCPSPLGRRPEVFFVIAATHSAAPSADCGLAEMRVPQPR